MMNGEKCSDNLWECGQAPQYSNINLSIDTSHLQTLIITYGLDGEALSSVAKRTLVATLSLPMASELTWNAPKLMDHARLHASALERRKDAPLSRKSHPSTGMGVACVTRRDVPILCLGILRILATALVSSDTQSYLRSSWNSDETYNNRSNIDWRRKVCICSNIW